MKEILNIKSEYMRVNTEQGITYGGNQQFFKELPGINNRGKYKGGCGAVALGDLLCYLSTNHRRVRKKGMLRNVIPLEWLACKSTMDKAQYMAYFNRLCKWIAWCPTGNGMAGVTVAARFCWLMHCTGLPYRAIWGFSERKRETRIKRMLVGDIPVILCIPKIFLNRKKTGLMLYVREQNRMKPAVRTSAHYVVITGLVEENGSLYYRISSWGKMYYIKEEEFRSFVKKHLFGKLLGTILWIYE